MTRLSAIVSLVSLSGVWDQEGIVTSDSAATAVQRLDRKYSRARGGWRHLPRFAPPPRARKRARPRARECMGKWVVIMPPPFRAMSKSACVVPFTTLDISPDGTPIICCQAPIALTVDGRLANAKTDSIEKIWNAPEIVELRGAMARGEKPDACRICWEHEKSGSLSLRRIMGESMHYT